jgi:hypothetical protein
LLFESRMLPACRQAMETGAEAVLWLQIDFLFLVLKGFRERLTQEMP